MSTLESAFHNYGLIVSIYVTMLILCALIFRRRYLVVLAIINFRGIGGLAAILAIPLISPFQIDYLSLFTAIFIEVFCAAVFMLAGIRIIKFLRSSAKVISDQKMILLLLAKTVFFMLNYVAADGQYGIFSDDSRIDFLRISPILSRTMYLDMIIDFTVLLSVGLRCLSAKRIRWRDFGILLALISLNYLTGSKGATFMNIFFVVLFLYSALPHAFSFVSKTRAIRILCSFAIIFFVYTYQLSIEHQVSIWEQIGLLYYRFLMSADARIMSFDPNITNYVLLQPHSNLLAELFRGPARILGASVAEFPIGVYQFQAELNTTNYVGATNQLSAMFVIYDDWGGRLISFVVIASVVGLAFLLFSTMLNSRNSGVAWVSVAALYYLSTTMCLGFDAFVQMLPISVIIVLLFWTLRQLVGDAWSTPRGSS